MKIHPSQDRIEGDINMEYTKIKIYDDLYIRFRHHESNYFGTVYSDPEYMKRVDVVLCSNMYYGIVSAIQQMNSKDGSYTFKFNRI